MRSEFGIYSEKDLRQGPPRGNETQSRDRSNPDFYAGGDVRYREGDGAHVQGHKNGLNALGMQSVNHLVSEMQACGRRSHRTWRLSVNRLIA